MADDPAAFTAAGADAAYNSSSSSSDDEEGTDTDASNSDAAADEAFPDMEPTPPPPAAPAAPPPPPPEATPTTTTPNPTPAPPPLPPPQSAAASADESRRLFQRLWTDEEEILILRGFLDFTSRRGTTFASHQYDTGPFYEEIRRKLTFDFSKNQLIEKLRRLKKKYRVCAHRMISQGSAFAFKSAHEHDIYDLARLIWRPGLKRDGGDASDDDDINPVPPPPPPPPPLPPATTAELDDGTLAPTSRTRGGRRVRRRTIQEPETAALPMPMPVPMVTDTTAVPVVVTVENSIPPVAAPALPGGVLEETLRSCLSPLLKELIGSAVGTGPIGLGFGGAGGGDLLGLGIGVAGLNPGLPGDEKWRQQQILELEVYLKRIELVREQVTATLAELRSSGG